MAGLGYFRQMHHTCVAQPVGFVRASQTKLILCSVRLGSIPFPLTGLGMVSDSFPINAVTFTVPILLGATCLRVSVTV